jgi:quercetin dioxygenase-like cupin family protein
MTLPRIRPLLLLSATALAFVGGAGAVAQDAEPPVSSEPLLQTTTTIIGQPLSYPTGAQAEVTASVVTLQPGAETGWHVHPGPLYGRMLEGELTVDYGERGTRVYLAGDNLMEAVDWPHNGINTGTGPARVLVVFMGAEGMPVSSPVDAPGN